MRLKVASVLIEAPGHKFDVTFPVPSEQPFDCFDVLIQTAVELLPQVPQQKRGSARRIED
jgi:hypothetical protein